MKAALTAFLLLATWTVPAQAAPGGLERIAVGGTDYVRLSEWADEDGLKLTWRRKDDPIEVTGASANLRFAPDSVKAQINGVVVSLSLPVLNRNGVPWISLTDAQKTLQPILFPRKSRARVQTICLDAGHGGTDKGTSNGDHFEKTYTLLLAQAVGKLLEEKGFKVVMTRRGDETINVRDRPALVARSGADLFICLHYNSLPVPARGVEVHYMAPAGMKSSNGGAGNGNEGVVPGNASDDRNVLLAYEVLKSIVTSLPVEDLGLKHQHYLVLKEARMPAILIEAGFLSDPQDAKMIYDAGYRQRMAHSIADGVAAYKRAVEEAPAQMSALKLPAPGRN